MICNDCNGTGFNVFKGEVCTCQGKGIKMSERILTCVYCGQEYPQDTPAYGDKILTDHIKICSKHPMREAEYKIKKLREALIGLVGCDNTKDLEEMKTTINTFMSSNISLKDALVTINAIDVLLETSEE
jgi:hypothetical protein